MNCKVCLCDYKCSRRPEEGVGFPGAEVTGSSGHKERRNSRSPKSQGSKAQRLLSGETSGFEEDGDGTGQPCAETLLVLELSFGGLSPTVTLSLISSPSATDCNRSAFQPLITWARIRHQYLFQGINLNPPLMGRMDSRLSVPTDFISTADFSSNLPAPEVPSKSVSRTSSKQLAPGGPASLPQPQMVLKNLDKEWQQSALPRLSQHPSFRGSPKTSMLPDDRKPPFSPHQPPHPISSPFIINKRGKCW
ncbi:uncharacterized protein [Alexandromys fortis]|uniref:uncharacterized protein isoform X2 n=1 Tax=Alexandromys fortis TaxID=100897 RepID=UPI002152CF8A|nr:uncharacterized protein LOC126500741 isoform X2 [Microtus fortis]